MSRNRFGQMTAQAKIQQEILDCLLDLEDLTTGLLTCEEEQLIDRLDERQQILDEIDELLGRQRELDAALAPAAASADPADPDTPAPPDTGPSPDALAQQQDEARWQLTGECRAAACRVQELDRQVVARLQNAQHRVLQKIRAAGKSAGAHAARYYVPTTPTSTFTGSM